MENKTTDRKKRIFVEGWKIERADANQGGWDELMQIVWMRMKNKAEKNCEYKKNNNIYYSSNKPLKRNTGKSHRVGNFW